MNLRLILECWLLSFVSVLFPFNRVHTEGRLEDDEWERSCFFQREYIKNHQLLSQKLKDKFACLHKDRENRALQLHLNEDCSLMMEMENHPKLINTVKKLFVRWKLDWRWLDAKKGVWSNVEELHLQWDGFAEAPFFLRRLINLKRLVLHADPHLLHVSHNYRFPRMLKEIYISLQPSGQEYPSDFELPLWMQTLGLTVSIELPAYIPIEAADY